jgi:hypothetical protein
MKIIRIISCCIVVTAVLILTFSCLTNDNDGSKSYYIKFTADGQSHEFNYGPVEIDDNAFASLVAGILTYIGATPEQNISIGGVEPDNYMYITTYLTSTGTATSTIALHLRLNGVNYVNTGPDSITITAYGAVGERIEGTFTTNLEVDGGIGTLQITDGEFSVIRAENMASF